ncbi:transmembrane protein 186-like [Scylla paramamosain]|uniref:transmembrane protein 186-like n=1 Tax=Scylla paramamosain TaxID=85552 RepID=UPI003082FC5B
MATKSLTHNGVLPPSAFPVTLAVGTLALGMLGIMGEAFRRVIGILYLSDDEQLVKISHLSFFGRRIDVVLPIQDIVPLSDSGERVSDAFFVLSLRFGGVVDASGFEKVFGKCLE